MKIAIVRHARVIFRDKLFSTGEEFDEGRTAYDATPIAACELRISPVDYPFCFASSKTRAIETAKIIYGGTVIITDELVEVKNAALFFTKLKIPTLLRSVIGRIAWFFNYSKMPETREQTMSRANAFVEKLLQDVQEDTLLVTHGFFMHCLRHALRKRGFKGRIPYRPANALLYLFEKNPAL